jgi:carboxyl-terminal processing protease
MTNGITGLILDFRHNGGGSLEEAINLTGLFIKKGPVVQVKDLNGGLLIDEDIDESVLWDGPLMVLTSRFSASASEIVAAALQDYGRALVVGDRTTHGKGTVQQLIPLGQQMQRKGVSFASDPGALKLTIRKFYRINGASTQKVGVTPDIILPSVNNYAELGEESLEHVLEWDVIKATDYAPLNQIPPLVADLKGKSEKRVAASREFDLIRDDIARYQKAIKDKSVSLNETERLKERAENKQRDEVRKKERLAHKDDPKFYEISVRNALEPGLQYWQPKTNQVARVKDPDDESDPIDAELEKLPPLDIHLDEAKHIMGDLIQAVAKGKGVAAAR